MERIYDLCTLDDPSPACFDTRRKEFRDVIKNAEPYKQREVLKYLYKLGVLVNICYGDEDCNTGVSGWLCDIATVSIATICKKIKFSYEVNGILKNCSFLSNNDWEKFNKVFGKNNKKLDLSIAQAESLAVINKKIVKIQHLILESKRLDFINNYNWENEISIILEVVEQLLSEPDKMEEFIETARFIDIFLQVAVPVISLDVYREAKFYSEIFSRIAVLAIQGYGNINLATLKCQYALQHQTIQLIELFIPDEHESSEKKLQKLAKEIFVATDCSNIPNATIHSAAFLAELSQVKYKNIAARVIAKFLALEFNSRSASDRGADTSFKKELTKIIENYEQKTQPVSDTLAVLTELGERIHLASRKSLGAKSFEPGFRNKYISLIIDEDIGSYESILNEDNDEYKPGGLLKQLRNYQDVLKVQSGRQMSVCMYAQKENSWIDDDIIVFYRLNYNSDIGTRCLEEDLRSLLSFAITQPGKLFLLIIGMPESVVTDAVKLLLPKGITSIPDNIFTNWNSFAESLQFLCSSYRTFADGKELPDFKNFQDMHLILQQKMLQSGSGLNFSGRHLFYRWYEFFQEEFEKKNNLCSFGFLRAVALSGRTADTARFLWDTFPDNTIFFNYLNDCVNLSSPDMTLDQLNDVVAGLFNIALNCDHLNSCHSRIIEIVRLMTRKTEQPDILIKCYESFRDKGKNELYRFLTKNIGRNLENEQDLDSVCKIIERSHLSDIWIDMVFSLDDSEKIKNLIREKLILWLKFAKVPKMLCKVLLRYLESGSDALLTDMKKLSLQAGYKIFRQNCKSNYYSLFMKREPSESCRFNTAFLPFYQNRFPDINHRLEMINLALDVANVIETKVGVAIADNHFLEEEEIIQLVETPASIDFADVFRFLLYNIESELVTIENEEMNDLILKNREKETEAVYSILQTNVSTTFKKSGLDLLLRLIGSMPPTDKILTDLKKDKKSQDIAVILEAGIKIGNLGTFLAAYFKDRNKKQFLLTAQDILRENGVSDYTPELIENMAGKFTDYKKSHSEPVVNLPIDIESFSPLKWKESKQDIPISVSYFLINICLRKNSDQDLNLLEQIKNLLELPSLEKFLTDLAKSLVDVTENKTLKSFQARNMLYLFGKIGTDLCFCPLLKAKCFKHYHYIGELQEALEMLNTPFAIAASKYLQFDTKSAVSLSLLDDISTLREEIAIQAKNKTTTNKMEREVKKYSEKIIKDYYLAVLSENMCVPWSLCFADWRKFFVNDVSGLKLARFLIWGLYDDGKLVQPFSVDEFAQCIDLNRRALVEPSSGNVSVNLVHPVELTVDHSVNIENLIRENRMNKLFTQIDRRCYRKNGSRNLDSFKGNKFRGRFWKVKIGKWFRDEFEWLLSGFERNVVINGDRFLISLEIADGFNVSNPSDAEYKIGGISVKDNNNRIIPFTSLPARTYSEICNEIESYFLPSC